MTGERARAVWRLATLSFIALFAEVAFIRLLSSETRLFGFYKNMALISCFLGMGAGAASGKGAWGRWFVPALAAFGLLVSLAAPRFVYLSPASGDEFIWLARASTLLDAARFYGALLLLFALNTCVFYAGGQAVGAAFEGLPPLVGYSANLLGSLAGTLAFTAISYAQGGPFWWLALLMVLGVSPLVADPPARRATLAVSAVSLLFFGLFDAPSTWSPYNKLTTKPFLTPEGDRWGTSIETNWTYHQRAIDLSPAFLRLHPDLKDVGPAAYYELPYHYAHPKKVLILGAGAGNDVAAALRNGAEDVTAVEIDPAIARLGQEGHPEKPYASPKVHLVIGDARAFVKNADTTYDLIVYGLVDSHTVVSAMSNVRLDNFLYTRQSFDRVRTLLAPGGMVSLSFSSGFGESWWILRRIEGMLGRAFGHTPVAFDVGYDCGFLFLTGPGAPQTITRTDDLAKAQAARDKFASVAPSGAEDELTDDWPFLYLRGRHVPAEYWFLCGAAVLFAAVLLRRSLPGGLRAVDGRFFFLGAGFLLVEVRNLAELSLLFGSTWVVNAFVISGVLSMALLANVIASRWTVPLGWAFGALALTVAVTFLSPVQHLAGAAPWLRAVAGTAVLSMPFLFSGLVFSATFKTVASPAAAYGSNLLGAVVGGVLEHESLRGGIRSLSVLALLLYGAAYVWVVWRPRRARAA